MLQLHKRHEVEHVVVSLLQDVMRTRIILNKLSNCIKSIGKVQILWRQYNQRKEAFRNCLMILWDKYYVKIFEDIGGHSKKYNGETPREKNHTPVLITALVRQS